MPEILPLQARAKGVLTTLLTSSATQANDSTRNRHWNQFELAMGITNHSLTHENEGGS